MEAGLESSNDVYEASNSQIVQSINKAAQDQGSKESDMEVVNAAKEVRQKTTEIVDYVSNVKSEVGLISAGGDESVVYERSTLKKYEEPSNYLVEKKERGRIENAFG